MCGLIGVVGTSESALEVYLGLMNLQHRGQDGAGILTTSTKAGKDFHIEKGTGLVENVFSERSFKNLHGASALGHTRYATIGRNNPNLLQPFLNYDLGIGLAHNGQIVNFYELREKLLGKSFKLQQVLESDSDLILRLLSMYLDKSEVNAQTLFSAVSTLMNDVIGSYAIVGLVKDGSLFGFRDPNGIRPLFFGKKKTKDGNLVYALASETVALNFIGYTDVEEVKAGEAIYVETNGKINRKIIHQAQFTPCMFEWVYFARVESEFDNISVYKARFQLGQILAKHLKELNIKADVVIPVPETSRVAAIAIAESLDLPFRELLIKNRYVQRTFILEGQDARQEAIRRKLFPIAEEIKGKRCLVVDDSIVRGNTAAQIIKLIRQAGASEVIVVSSCPPISYPCYYGIDFPSPTELVAYNRSEKEVAEQLGADQVIYQTIDGLKTALEQNSLCTGCLTGAYPTDTESAAEFEENRLKDRTNLDKPTKKSRC